MKARMIASSQHHIPKLQSVSSFLFYSQPFSGSTREAFVNRPRNLVAELLHPARVRKGNFNCTLVMRRLFLPQRVMGSLRGGD